MITITTWIEQNKSQNLKSILLQTDITKVFDNILPSKLVDIMYKLGFETSYINWVQKDMINRAIIMENDNDKNIVNTSISLSQGSKLTPFLFNVYKGSLYKLQDKDCMIIWYADDF